MGEFIGDKLDYFYWFTASMLILATGIIIFFAIRGMIKNGKNAKKTIMTVGGLLSVLALSYFVFASDSVTAAMDKLNQKLATGDEITSSTSQLVGMGLWSFYIFLSIAIASIVIMGGLKMMSKR